MAAKYIRCCYPTEVLFLDKMTVCKKIEDVLVYVTSNFNHFYLIPLFGLVCWYTLVFGLVGMWVAQGSRGYPEYGEPQSPMPLERIGAIVCPGFFVAFVAIHSVVFCVLIYLDYYHRKIGKLIKFIRPTLQKRLAFSSIAFGILAQIFFLVQAVVSTVFFQRNFRAAPHYAVMLATFAVLIMISLALNFVNYYIMGQYYRKYVNGERWNKFTISFIVKITWLIGTIATAILCSVFYVRKNVPLSLIFEWVFHFWYGLLLAFWTYDLYPLTELRALRKHGDSPEKRPSVRNFFKKLPQSSPQLSLLEKSSMGGFTTITPVDSDTTEQTVRTMV